MEVHEGRVYEAVDPRCCYCDNPVAWMVSTPNDDFPDYMQVCDAHKFTAFS